MPVEVIFPRVDMDMTTGKISQWFVRDGETIEKGAPLFEIETDKAAMEIESPATGILRTQDIAPGAEVAVGAPVAWIVGPNETWSPSTAAPAASAPAAVAHEPVAEPAAPAVVPAAQPQPALLRATPLARREAARNGVDLGAIRGSGPHGRVLHADVEAALAARPAAPPPAPVPKPLSRGPGPLHLERFGPETGVPVVLLHGFGSDHTSWRDIWRRLEAGRAVLALDLPGHGRSPQTGVAFAELVDSVIATLRQAGVERFHLVGHSLGGAVALGVADTLAGSVCSLGLIAPGGMGPEVNAAFFAGFVAAERAESVTPWLRRLFADPSLVTDGFVRATLRAQAEPGRREFQRALIDRLFPDGTQALALADVLHGISVPVKVIWGRADAIIPARHARGLPGHVAVHLLPGVGHLPHLEAPALVARLIAELAAAGGA